MWNICCCLVFIQAIGTGQAFPLGCQIRGTGRRTIFNLRKLKVMQYLRKLDSFSTGRYIFQLPKCSDLQVRIGKKVSRPRNMADKITMKAQRQLSEMLWSTLWRVLYSLFIELASSYLEDLIRYRERDTLLLVLPHVTSVITCPTLITESLEAELYFALSWLLYLLCNCKAKINFHK